MFSKPTDRHFYLLKSSAHPKSSIKSIPYSIALRIKRICSDPSTLQKRLIEYGSYLIARGYDANDVQQQFNKANVKSREELLKPKQKSHSPATIIPLVMEYNPNLPNIRNIINKYLPILYSSPRMAEMFPRSSIIPAFRKCKSLKTILSKTSKNNANSGSEATKGCIKCTRKRCDLCQNFLLNTDTFSSVVNGRIYHIQSMLTCTNNNVIYLANCSKCNLQYVGSTCNEFKIRFRNHKSDVKRGKESCELAVHFNSSPHSLDQIHFIMIEQIHKNSNIEEVLTNREHIGRHNLNRFIRMG